MPTPKRFESASSRWRRPIVWVIGAGIVLGLPVLIAGFPAATHDGRVHGVWLELFAKQFWSGDLYPRWLQGLDGGLGGPSFYFYPPLPFFVAALFQPLFGGSDAWHALGASAALALVLSGVFTLLWLRETIAERHAAIAAVLFMMMPYHFAVDLHVRGAFGEFWSFVWLPAVLFFVHRVVERAPGSMLGLAASYAALIMTHLPTTLIFSAIPPVYALWIAPANRRLVAAIAVSVLLAVGIGLSAIYLLPAMLDQGSVMISAMHSGDSYYENWFFFGRDPNGNVILGRSEFVRALFWMMLSMLAIGTCALIAARRTARGIAQRELVFWSVVAVVATLMTLPLSRPLYMLVAPLQVIQFPWRFNVLIVIAVAALIGVALDAMPHPLGHLQRIALGIGSAIIVWWTVFTAEPLFTHPEVSQATRDWLADKSNTPEYRPKWMHGDTPALIRRLRGNADTISRAVVVQGEGALAVLAWKPRHLSLTLDARSPTTVEVRQFYYPNWIGTLNGSASITVTPAPSTGLLRMDLPAGTHTVDLHFVPSVSERRGIAISALSLVACVGAVAVSSLRRRR